MKIRLDSARFEPFRWQETVRLDPAELGLGEGVALTPVEVRGMLSFASPDFLLSARLTYRQSVPCDRCLEPVEEEMEAALDLIVVERPRAPGAAAQRRDEEEPATVTVTGGVVDLVPFVVEQVQLGLPTHPLCREECAGLCPSCGANWNVGPCACQREPDPRWAALAAWREKSDGRGSDR